MKHGPISVFLFCLALVPLIQTARSQPASNNADVQAIVDQLKALNERARTERGADRWVLNSLDTLIRKYEWPWRENLLNEDFSDGDYTGLPAWQVVSGRFWVDASLGLRSRTAVRSRPTAKTPPKRTDDDVGRQILDSLFGSVLETEADRAADTSQESSGNTEIILPLEISHAFAMQVEFSMHNAPSENGRLVFGIYQGPARDAGYQIALQTGSDPVVDLLRVRAGRSAIIDSIRLDHGIDEGELHALGWRQDDTGRIDLLLDDQRLISTSDRAFRGPYQGLNIVNGGGDYAIRSISLQVAE